MNNLSRYPSRGMTVILQVPYIPIYTLLYVLEKTFAEHFIPISEQDAYKLYTRCPVHDLKDVLWFVTKRHDIIKSNRNKRSPPADKLNVGHFSLQVMKTTQVKG